jgi:hypothetical protein
MERAASKSRIGVAEMIRRKPEKTTEKREEQAFKTGRTGTL